MRDAYRLTIRAKGNPIPYTQSDHGHVVNANLTGRIRGFKELTHCEGQNRCPRQHTRVSTSPSRS
eukprot:1367202-Rhodomonas_salina.1